MRVCASTRVPGLTVSRTQVQVPHLVFCFSHPSTLTPTSLTSDFFSKMETGTPLSLMKSAARYRVGAWVPLHGQPVQVPFYSSDRAHRDPRRGGPAQ